MAQSLFPCNYSKLQFQRFQRSNLGGGAFHLRPTAVSGRRHGRRSFLRLASTESTAFESTPTPRNQEETELAAAAAGDSLAQTNTAPITPQKNIFSWNKIVLGAVVILAIPLCKKALYLRELAKNVDSVMEVVQIVAAGAKKAAGDLVVALPNGRVKEAALKLERIAELVDKNAAFADSFLDKVDDAAVELDKKLAPVIDGREVKPNDVAAARNILQKVKISDVTETIAAAAADHTTLDPKGKGGLK